MRYVLAFTALSVILASSVAYGQPASVYVNGRALSYAEIRALAYEYGAPPLPGRYWYDTRSGLYGLQGGRTLGMIRPGYNFGPLARNASGGNTGLLLNGRELDVVEAAYFQQQLGARVSGRWWLDGYTGLVGIEGDPTPITAFGRFRQTENAQSNQRGTPYSWRSNTTDAYGGSDGKCSYVSIPGSGSVMTGDCDQ
jgi:hypothetical protein